LILMAKRGKDRSAATLLYVYVFPFL
jgi:hypothetical protein